MNDRSNNKATASMVLGIIGMIAWIFPLFGFPITIVGLVLGIKGKTSEKAGFATAGIVLSIIGLVLTSMNSAIGAFMAINGMM